jgi:hypothetical protein
MLGITTMKLFQEWMHSTPSVETQSLIDANRELLIIGMSATGTENSLLFIDNEFHNFHRLYSFRK